MNDRIRKLSSITYVILLFVMLIFQASTLPVPANAQDGGTGGDFQQFSSPYDVSVSTSDYKVGNYPTPVIYDVTVANIGQSPDDFTISATSSNNWADLSHIPHDPIHLDSHQAITFSIQVNIPSSAAAEDEDYLKINAAGAHSSTFFTTRTIVGCHVAFKDVPLNAFHQQSIMYAGCKKIMTGFMDSSLTHMCQDEGTQSPCFLPSRNVTRAEFAAVVRRAFAVPTYTPTTPTFKDVQPDSFAYLDIESVYHANIMLGYTPAQCATSGAPGADKGCFMPNNTVSRAEVLVAVSKAGAYPLYTPANPSFADLSSSSFAYRAVETLHAMNVVKGNTCLGSTSFCFFPSGAIRRVELSEIVQLRPK